MLAAASQGCQVPLDVVDCIVEEIARANDVSSLRSCALVCKDFTDISQKRIFADVDLTGMEDKYVDESRSPMTRLTEVLQNNARIADYVRTLRYEYGNYHNSVGSTFPSNLRSVETFYFSTSLDSQSWNATDDLFKNSFFRFLKSNDIIHLDITLADDIPLQIFLYLPKLVKLSMDAVTFQEGTQCRIPDNPPRLRSFAAERSGGLILKKLLKRFPEQFVDFSHIEEFAVNFDENNPDTNMFAVVIQQSSLLKSLIIRCNTDALDFRDVLSSALTTSIKSLKKIEIDITLDSEDTDPYCHLVHELDKLSNVNVLEEINLAIFVAMEGACTTDLSRWSYLDKVLSRKRAFPDLKKVGLEVYIGHGWEIPDRLHQGILSVQVDAFPLMQGAKHVDFNMIVETQLD